MAISPSKNLPFEELSIVHRETMFKPRKSIRTWLIGRPLSTADAPHQTIGKFIGLAVFSSDALSSVAYGPQEMMMMLAGAGVAALQLAFPVAIAIFILLAILTFSYEQTIHAYPNGGGAYIVARDNLGELPAQTAGAALLTDYILTVAVSISSGVAQIVSAYPALYNFRVGIALGMIFFVMLVNLRGVKESGVTFAIPTYYFLIMIFITTALGFVRLFAGSLGTVANPPSIEGSGLMPLSLFVILRAFANGTTSLTGVEAISNGITAFREPRDKNARTTLLWMSGIMGSLLLGITYLSVHIGAIPAESETVISQLARTVYAGRGLLYLSTISSTTVILMMAANTAFADFPRLGALHAGDGFLPRQFTYRGSRLVFSNGIIALGVISSLLVIAFQASVSRLIPLYAIGVFLSFTLSQFGMARRWWKSGHLGTDEVIVEPGSTIRYDKGWKHKMFINGLGSICTAIVVIVFGVTKFKDGAWVVILLTPALVMIFFSIHHHYKKVARNLTLEDFGSLQRIKRQRVILLVSTVHRGTLYALNYALSISDDVTAVHVSVDPEDAKKVKSKWENWGDRTRLVILDSPYRLLIEPLLEYIDHITANKQLGEVLTIIVPQFVTESLVTGALHANTAYWLRKALVAQPGVVIIEVPYQID